MDAAALTGWICEQFEGVATEENFGFRFFFFGDDRKLPFATIALEDTEHDSVSHLARDGGYRLNIGVGRATFQQLFADPDGPNAEIDHTVRNRLMPHPVYAAQSFVCIVNPEGGQLTQAKELLAEAYDLAVIREGRRAIREESAES